MLTAEQIAAFNHELRQLLVAVVTGPRASDDEYMLTRHALIEGLQKGILEVQAISPAGEMRWGKAK